MGIRIIGGRRKGKKLRPVPGGYIRPTSNRLRETIFNVIADWVPGAAALDMFAGTGALGIEALSRGARLCVFIDQDPRSLDLVRENLRSCGFEKEARLIRLDIARRLSRVKNASPAFDLVFMDPPYERDRVNPALTSLAESRCLAPDAIVVVEHSPAEPIWEESPDFEVFKSKRQGRNVASFLRRRPETLLEQNAPGKTQRKDF
ncbi:16S rRNA (Guanine(966)-N(2))-methyltransferase RsmD [Candidatus Desulfarcum epimagneticum]|uniref:16S rRNA (Guanine(966)-N(2))-methyltransferase RsmD n=1 Tax=uncultured Desulfobacteraceae bacterium TaxID=218296 RepID=A0A484HG43_9BACT|nr:16S rRNA (Guanine(966)-N(2))-methyltransferase RsmD [uncultured Desulfobacteraceae bacterium]